MTTLTSIMTTNSDNTGYLEIILGGMYAGKTSRLVEIYRQCVFCNIPVVVINHSIDTRYDSNNNNNFVTTHDQIKIPCLKLNNLFDIWYNYETEDKDKGTRNELRDELKEQIASVVSSDVILINEGQFFAGLEEFVRLLLEKGKKIYVCGLDGDFKREKFGKILDLIPLCDKVTKLTSLCAICKNGTPGIFSKRITKQEEQTLVGSDNYIPVCRKCYS